MPRLYFTILVHLYSTHAVVIPLPSQESGRLGTHRKLIIIHCSSLYTKRAAKATRLLRIKRSMFSVCMFECSPSDCLRYYSLSYDLEEVNVVNYPL